MEEFMSFFGQKPNDDICDNHPDSSKHVFNFSTLTGSIPNITITRGSEGQVWIERKRKRKLSDLETRDAKRWRGWCQTN